MPMMNFHTARIVDPGKFDEESFRTKEIADGILAVMGKLKDGDGSMVLQALRFAADKFTAAEAKAWCKEHDYKLLEFAEAKEEDETEAGEEAKPEKHLALVEAIRARKYVGEFGYGLCTADAIVAKAIDEIGVGAVQRYAKLAGSFDREAAVKDASRRLTYCEKDMVAEITATVGSFQDLLPKGMTAPPHTLMLIRNVLTTPRKDRDGDILRSEGAKVDPAGPLLWQHMYNLPIGKHLAVVEQTKEHVKEVNALLDLNELTEDVAKLFEAGALRFSHGFQALDWEEMKNESTQRMDERPSFDIKSFEVLERSAVSIPSCVDAVVELYARGKLCSEPMQRKAKALFESRQKVFTSVSLDSLATKAAVKFESCPVAESKTWDADAAVGRLRKWAAVDVEEPSEAAWAKYGRGFARIIGDGNKMSDFSLPHHDVEDGKLVVNRSGIAAATAAVHGGRTPMKFDSESEKSAIAAHLKRHYKDDFDEEFPEEEKITDVLTKAGRVLSQRNMDALGDCLADLDELAEMMPDDMPRGANALMQRVMSRLKEVIESAKPEQERPDAKPKEGKNGKGLVETAILGAANEQLRKYQQIIDTELKVRRANAFAAEYRRLTV